MFIGGNLLSYEDQYELWQSLASDSDATNLTMGKRLINVGQHKLEKALNFSTEESRTYTLQTDAISGTSNMAYRLPENFNKLIYASVAVGSNNYRAQQIQDPSMWRDITFNITSTSDFLQFIFIKRGTLDRFEIYPPPSSTNTLTLFYTAMGKDLVAADYTEGTITTLANGGTAVTASGSTFTSSMAGRYFKINSDGEWYKIASFGTTTTLTLTSKYQGIAIAAGTEAYTIGQMPTTPEDLHILPVYYALWKYFLSKQKTSMAREYRREWIDGVEEAKANWGNDEASTVLDRDDVLESGVINPNDYPSGMS